MPINGNPHFLPEQVCPKPVASCYLEIKKMKPSEDQIEQPNTAVNPTLLPLATRMAPLSTKSSRLRIHELDHLAEMVLKSCILILDDSDVNIRLVVEILRLAGFKNVHSEIRAALAVQRIRELKPDLIALDLRMPFVSGIEIMEILGSEENNLEFGPVLVLTADTSIETTRRALDLGADDFMSKPIDARELCLRVKNLLTAHVLRKQLESHNDYLKVTVEARTIGLKRSNEALSMEIKSRKETDLLLRNAKRRLEFLLTSSPNSIFSTQPTPPFAVTFVSDSVQSQLGYSAKELTSSPSFWLEHLHPADSASDLVHEELGILEGRFSLVYRFLHKDNTYRWMQSDATVIHDKEGAATEIIGSWTDITVHKRTEEALAEVAGELSTANDRLREFDRLKSEFVATASHEMRTPLTVIREFTSLLSDDAAGSSTEEKSESYEAILRNCDRLTGMLDYLLDFQRIEAGKLNLRRGKVNIVELLERCHKDLLPRCAVRQLAFNNRTPENLPCALADERQLEQVVINLIGNAIKFTPDGGAIGLNASFVDGLIQISVEDTGRGIATDELENVFEAFRQVDRIDGPGFGGTGLGLTISRRIVELHGGGLSVRSTLGSGSTFTFSVPEWSEFAGVEAQVGDSLGNEGAQGFLLVIRPNTNPLSIEDVPKRRLQDLASVVKAALRSSDHGLTLSEYGCIVYVFKCNKAGMDTVKARLFAALSLQYEIDGIPSIKILDLSATQNVHAELSQELRPNDSLNTNAAA